MSATIGITPISEDEVHCVLRSPMGRRLKLTGSPANVEPDAIDGDDVMTGNVALRHNAWAYAKHELIALGETDEEEQKAQRKLAHVHESIVKTISGLTDRLGDEWREGWCSECFTFSRHQKVVLGKGMPAYLCGTCGGPTSPCPAPRCPNFATRPAGPIRAPRFCAEHRHALPSFERAEDLIDSPDEYEELLRFERKNLSRHTKLVTMGVLGAGLVGPAALLAAPAIGGAIGVTFGGYGGAAASSWGLATLGGGSIAAGGLGVAGGTMVVTAAGAALGGAFGTTIVNAYVSDDKSFDIEKFRDGDGVPVVIARGFLTQSAMDWRAAVEMVENRYPDSPIYLVRWGSKEKKAFANLAFGTGARYGGALGVAGVGAGASKAAAAMLGPIGLTMSAAGLAKNPWHTAVVRADRTSAALAGILARTRFDRVVLVGHSLGGRVMIGAAEILSTDPNAPKIDELHLLGTAKGRKSDWSRLAGSVSGTVHNYYSTNDGVLKYAFKMAMGGSTPVGLGGFTAKAANIVDHDVSTQVAGHTEYFNDVTLA